MRAYDRRYFRGVLLDEYTIAWVHAMERKLGAKIDPIQGSYNVGGVSASGGTHDGGGAIDFWCYGKPIPKVVNASREVGGDAWHRQDLPGVWTEHIHAIIRGNKKLSSSAQWQDGPLEWRASPGGDGLTGGTPDPNQYHPKHDFDYAGWIAAEQQKNLITRLTHKAGALARELKHVRHLRKLAIDKRKRLLHD